MSDLAGAGAGERATYSRVMVTGGAGFIGSHLCERLVGEGVSVSCVDNFNEFYDPAIKRANIQVLDTDSLFTLHEGDIRDPDFVDSVFRKTEPEAVVHLAAMAGVRPSIQNPVLYQDVNVTGTAMLLETIRRHPVANFLFGSSSSVYGSRLKVPFHEDDPVDRPISPYAATKAAGELLCYTYHHLHGVPTSCLRFFTVYGPRQRPEMAIHKFARLITDGNPVPVYGDGSSRRDYTYIEDIIDGIIGALNRPHGYEIFNLGESQTISLRDLISLLEEGLGKKARVETLPDQPGDVPVTFADVSKARSMLGYRPSTEIRTGVEQFISWFKRGQ